MSGQWCKSCGVYLMFEGDLLRDVGYVWQGARGWVHTDTIPGALEAITGMHS